MILTLGIVTIILALATWLFAMFLSWKLSHGVALHPIDRKTLEPTALQAQRTVRKYWYHGLFRLEQGRTILLEKAEKLLVQIFPKAGPAFTKKDPLTGLEQGPSSYFLLQISESKPAKQTPLQNRKKKV